MTNFVNVCRLHAAISEQHLMALGNVFYFDIQGLRNRVSSVLAFDATRAHEEYKRVSNLLRKEAKSAGLIEPFLLNGPATCLMLVDPECPSVVPRTDFDVLVEHLKVYQRDVEIMSRAEGDNFSIQNHIRGSEWDLLRTRIFAFLFPGGVWSERRAMQLCVVGFNVVKPWSGRDKLEMTFNKHNVSICKLMPSYQFTVIEGSLKEAN